MNRNMAFCRACLSCGWMAQHVDTSKNSGRFARLSALRHPYTGRWVSSSGRELPASRHTRGPRDCENWRLSRRCEPFVSNWQLYLKKPSERDHTFPRLIRHSANAKSAPEPCATLEGAVKCC